LAAFTVQAAVIYKWVDADGVVHYSDQASPGAEKIYTSGSASTAAPGSAAARAATAPNVQQKQAGGTVEYAEFSIDSPGPEQTFFGDDVVNVHLNLQPALKANQSLIWHLSGKQLDEQANSTAFTLVQMARGTYMLAATITDQQTGESRTSNSVTFFVRQPSALSPRSPQHH
jgi:Domain of unknown function (DUF4124)